MVKVLFVCLGNICRSPTAHALFQAAVNKAQLEQRIQIDSAGTGGWHSGSPPDQRAQKTALAHGYDMSHLQARQVHIDDFSSFDYILAMDHQNLQDLKAIAPANYHGVLGLFLTQSGIDRAEEVPDPYYGGDEQFEYAIGLVKEGVDGLLERIRQQHKL